MTEAITRKDGAVYKLKPHERALWADIDRDQPRVSYEWSNVWDGTEAHGIALNDAQCARLDAMRAKHGDWSQEYRAFIAHDCIKL